MWYVYSEEGKKLSTGYESKEQADKRLGQIEYFKHNDEALEDAEYKGSSVVLNYPHESGNAETNHQVYTRDDSGEVVRIRFSGTPASVQSVDPLTPAYWKEKLFGVESRTCCHSAFFDSASKTIRSVRDGIQEYYGVELGMEPANKVFTVYRSPETIASIASRMDGLPVINDHIDPSITPTREQTIASLTDTDIVELMDKSTDSTLYLENKAAVSDEVIKLKDSGKKQFSLGYLGKLREHSKYDFEQYDLEPTHLALVDSARGGSVLTFVDKKEINMGEKTLSKVFLDAEGNPNLQQIVEIAQELPEALKKIPMDKLQEVIPMLQEIVSMSGGADMPDQPDSEVETEENMVDMEAEYEDMEGEEKEKFEDSKLFKSIVKSKGQSFADSKQFKDALKDAVKANSEAIEKARNFVDEQYTFADKSTEQIMRDALAVEHGETEFKDSELSTAFKMLKKSGSSLEAFADSQGKSALESRIEQQLEAK